MLLVNMFLHGNIFVEGGAMRGKFFVLQDVGVAMFLTAMSLQSSCSLFESTNFVLGSGTMLFVCCEGGLTLGGRIFEGELTSRV